MSGLPSGYTQLEYIQSTGTQWINTGFKPTGNTKIICDFLAYDQSTSQQGVFGSRPGTSGRFTLFTGRSTNALQADYDTAQTLANENNAISGVDLTQRVVISMSNDLIVNRTTVKSVTVASFSSTYDLFLFANNNIGTVQLPAKLKMYSCQIYDNGTLVRDFVPCKNASGAVGLYDTVGAQFYANAGTGSFAAGPEVFYEPDAPTNFAASVSGQTVALSWAASANAAGYRLKRDGVQIADQTGTTYTDTVPDGTTLCTYALTAYNDAGESAAVTLLVLVQLELITDRTRADVANQTNKGFYNASDLNRVGAAVEYIAGRFAALGYACPVTVKKDWLTSDAPTASQLETYRQNIVTLRSRIAVMASTPEAPASMAGLNYVKANNIEQILLDLDALIDNITKSWYFSGEVYAGEV